MRAAILLIVAVTCCYPSLSVAAPSGSDIIRSAEDEQRKRVDEVIDFLHDKVEQQFADLTAASQSRAVKSLYAPFLAKSMTMLRPDIGAIGFGRRSSTGFDQRPLPLSYQALSRRGAFKDPNIWIHVATHRNNDRPDYPPILSDADVRYYQNLWRAFVLLAPFWVEDGTLIP